MTSGDMARRQQDLAADGRGEGQCLWCGSYRLDGKPPVLHSPGCERADDWKADPLAVLDRADDRAEAARVGSDRSQTREGPADSGARDRCRWCGSGGEPGRRCNCSAPCGYGGCYALAMWEETQ